MTRSIMLDPVTPVPNITRNAPSVNFRRILLDDAREKKEFDIGVSNVFWAIRASDGTATLSVHFNSQHANPLPVQNGLSMVGFTYNKIYITNTAQAGKWIDIIYFNDLDGRFNIQNFGGVFQSVELVVPATLTSTADVTIATVSTDSIIASNVNRKEVIIKNLSSTVTLRIGDSNTGATRGQPLEPLETLVLSTTAQVYGYNPDGAGSDVSVLEIEA